MRYLLPVLVALILPATSHAQQKISGVARDAETGTLLPCIEVWLRGPDSSWAQARTRLDGSFSLETTPRDSATLHFFSWGVQPVTMPVSGLVRGVDHVAEYRLPIHPAVGFGQNNYTRKDSVEGRVPPGPARRGSQPRYPERARGVNATVWLRFVVDSNGKVLKSPVEALIGARHTLFVDEINLWLRRTTFRPGTLRGVPRCEMMTQHFSFTWQEP